MILKRDLENIAPWLMIFGAWDWYSSIPTKHEKEDVRAVFNVWHTQRTQQRKPSLQGRIENRIGNVTFVSGLNGVDTTHFDGFILYGFSLHSEEVTKALLESMADAVIEGLGQNIVEFHYFDKSGHRRKAGVTAPSNVYLN